MWLNHINLTSKTVVKLFNETIIVSVKVGTTEHNDKSLILDLSILVEAKKLDNSNENSSLVLLICEDKRQLAIILSRKKTPTVMLVLPMSIASNKLTQQL